MLQFIDHVGVQGGRVGQGLHGQGMLAQAQHAEEVGGPAERQDQAVVGERSFESLRAAGRQHYPPVQVNLLHISLPDDRPTQRRPKRADSLLGLHLRQQRG